MPFRLIMLEQLQAKKYLDAVRDAHTLISYAQRGEDTLVLDILVSELQRPVGGFYVDLGAFHPRYLSNTQILKLLNWTGINIDANEDAISLFNAERPEDLNLCCGVASAEGELVFHKFEGGAINTFSTEMAEYQYKNSGAKIVSKNVVPVRTINQILEEKLPEGRSIDYMNIDLEGFDRAVLKSLDLVRFRPAVISIELFDVDILNLITDPTVSHLYANEYKLASVARDTYIFFDLTQKI